ncbi:Alpha/Beta hydrolase protein [Melampsora americana]|nr:Alpha/Beta hydrolase protein [Melampsora americana]
MKSWRALKAIDRSSIIRIGKQYLIIFFTLVNIITAFVLGARFGPQLLHESDSFSASSLSTASNLTSPGSILNPAPLPEHLDPVIYRASWSKPKSDISPIECDVFEPIDHENGKGSGWRIVFIHGLGSVDSSHGHQWRETLLSTLQRPLNSQSIGNLTGLRFILPKAPIIPVTVYSDQPNGGERPGWFDIKDWRDLNYLEDEDIKESKMQMNKTIIAGFSQGAVMTLLTSLTSSEPPAATLMLSGYLPLPFRLPLLLSTVLTCNAAKSGFNFLQRISQEAFGRAKFKTLPGLAHGFSEDEQIVVTNWIEGIVDQGTGGEFDDLLDNLIQPENKLDDPQYPVPHSLSTTF